MAIHNVWDNAESRYALDNAAQRADDARLDACSENGHCRHFVTIYDICCYCMIKDGICSLDEIEETDAETE